MYTLVGYSQFVSKKGQSFINLFVTYEDSRTQGVKTDNFLCNPDVIHGSLAIGCRLDVTFNRNGYPVAVKVA